MIPEVTVWPKPNGLPMATTKSPTRKSSESVVFNAVKFSVGILSTAISVSGSAPTISASSCRPSRSVTVICIAFAIT